MSDCPVSDMSKLMKFVCALYGFKNCSSINKARMNKLYKLAGRTTTGELHNVKKVNCAMLPPSEKSLSMKVKRSNLIAMMWNRADQLEPAEGLDPEDFWFKLDYN